nr:family 20 glycosylhydrolase [Allomuricauda sp.]
MAFFSGVLTTQAQAEYLFLPVPQQITYSEGTFDPGDSKLIWMDTKTFPELLSIGKAAVDGLNLAGYGFEVTAADGTQIAGSIVINASQIGKKDGYRLSIKPDEIELVANNMAGAFYAVQTLKQICLQSASNRLKCLTIVDWPDFPNRGIMTDVSRDKVPTMESLFKLVDMMASWKLNQLQLYTEHTFAYRNHETVWKGWSPMTGQQILELDAYCRERYIELVPNQNSMAHMSRWLGHPEYEHLSETHHNYTISPAEPGTMELLDELYSELLPHFSSNQINVGCDEASQIGTGKSKHLITEKGKRQLYVDFLLEIYKSVQKHGKTMQFWGDIILKEPKFIDQLPENIVGLIWGYEADHPFEEQCKKFKDSGVPFYVCPGTSSWRSVAGRTDNAKQNLSNAASAGLKHGATGYLITNWGDGGHWQPLTTALPGYAYGAALSWSENANTELDVPKVLDAFVFQDEAGKMGKAIYDLGNAYKETGITLKTASVLYELLHTRGLGNKWKGKYVNHDRSYFENTFNYIDNIVQSLEKTQMDCTDSELFHDEVRQAAKMLQHACKLALAQLETKTALTSDIPEKKRQLLAAELEDIIAEHKRLWVMRNRPGGLSNSVFKMSKLLKEYHQ